MREDPYATVCCDWLLNTDCVDAQPGWLETSGGAGRDLRVDAQCGVAILALDLRISVVVEIISLPSHAMVAEVEGGANGSGGDCQTCFSRAVWPVAVSYYKSANPTRISNDATALGLAHIKSGYTCPQDKRHVLPRTRSLPMSQNILITGGSGYLGGTLLARWKDANLDGYDKLFALVRTEAQAEAVKSYGAQPVTLNVNDEAAVKKTIVSNEINIVYYLIDSGRSDSQVFFIKALGELKKKTGQDVHLLHVSRTIEILVASPY